MMRLLPTTAGVCLALATNAVAQQDISAAPSEVLGTTNQEHPGRPLQFNGTSGPSEAGFSASGVTLLSWLDQPAFSPAQNSGNDCWGYTSPSGREYGIMGFSDGTAFVDLTDPGKPVILTLIAGPNSLWRDMKVYQDHAYSVTEGTGAGIQVFDMSDIDNGNVSLVNTINTGTPTTTSSHNIVIDETSGFLFRTGGGPTGNNVGLRIYDLAVPSTPVYVGNWLTSYIHDAQAVTYTSGPFAGREIIFACTEGSVASSLTILDVTNKAGVFVVDQISYNPPPGSSYSHQVWLTPDLQFAVLNDELDENGIFPSTNYVIDVSDIENISNAGSFTNANPAITHNLYLKDTRIFQANYSSGLRIFDATDPMNVSESGFFDTFPGSDTTSFVSLWSVYPFFPSGVVIGSDMSRGLFVWWVDTPKLTFSFPAGEPEFISPSGESIVVDITESAGSTLMPGTAKLHFDTGFGFFTISLVSLGGDSYRADFPATVCGSSIDYYISGQTADGITWTAPEGGGLFDFDVVSGAGAILAFEDDAEVDLGWTRGVGGDTATTGVWTLGDPIGTGSQSEDDHTPSGTDCFFTGQGSVGGGLGENDIDNGFTTLVTPVHDLTGMSNPQISYWRWWSNNGNGSVDDVMNIDVTNNGSTWVNVEALGPTGTDSVGGWIQHSFTVSDFVTPNATVQVRFVAEDTGSGSICEAAVDDFQLNDLICSDVSFYCTAKTTSEGCVPFMSTVGFPSASDTNPFNIRGEDHVAAGGGLLVYGYSKSNLNFHGGKLCVKAPVRTAGKTAKAKASAGCVGPATTGRLVTNFNVRIQSGLDPLLTAGTEVFAQWLQRDTPNTIGGFADNSSNGVRFTVAP